MSQNNYSKVVYLTSRGGCNSGLLCYRILKEDIENICCVADVHTLVQNFDSIAHKGKIILTYGPYEFLKKKNFCDMKLGTFLTHVFLPLMLMKEFMTLLNTCAYLIFQFISLMN